jgi:predicted dehydrogenase
MFCRSKLAFPGAGWAGKYRLKAIADSRIGAVAALSCASPESGNQAARTFPQAAVLISLDDLMEVGVDGIVIATPGALPAEQAFAAPERGMAILCLGRFAKGAPCAS